MDLKPQQRLYFDPESGHWRRAHKASSRSVTMVPGGEKKSKGASKTIAQSAFGRLPDEIIEQILQLTNPNGFASLIILNRKWRMVSQQAHLYTHHLSRCPSYSAAHQATPAPNHENSLPRLRRLFAQEIKRNLFEAYLRPRETVISLVSTSISSSSAPGGEAFHFSLSPRGHYVLAYSSSRIHILDVTGTEVVVTRELKILRRPASATITDDGSLLAVLSTDLQVDLYDLTGSRPKFTRAVALDHTPRTIALSPTGAVLAAAYDSGVEVSSLDPDCTSTERRAVKCYAVDSLSFSKDGTQLLGSTTQSRHPSTVILTAPYYNPGASLPEESVSALWTTSILFPNGSRDCSHAVLLPSATDDEASWTFTYDRVFETFRAVRIDDLRNGTTYFTGPIAEADSILKLLPSTLPAASKLGDLVAAGFQGCIWLYGVPEDLEALPNSGNGVSSNSESEATTPLSQIGRRNSAPSLRSGNRTRESIIGRTPQWQLLCDRARNTFVEGRKIGTLDRVSAMTWVNDMPAAFHAERLVAVAPGIVNTSPISEDDGMSPVDGGRIAILDFDYAATDGKKRMVTIEVGVNEPEILEEEHRDLDAEVAIVRRRTVAQRRGNRSHVSRSATSAAPNPRPEPPPMPRVDDDLGDPFAAPNNLAQRRASQQTTITEQSETSSIYEEAFDAPYSHTSPRSGTTLRRAATAAAVNRRLHPRSVAQEHIEYRRADGREEHPHESDADNWVPPPPPYTKDPIPPLPEHIQRSILAEAAAASNLQRANTQRAPSLDFPGLESSALSRSRTVASTSTNGSRREAYSFHRSMSDTTTHTPDRVSLEEPQRPVTSPTTPDDFDDLYDVSPPGTPQPALRREPSSTGRTINEQARRDRLNWEQINWEQTNREQANTEQFNREQANKEQAERERERQNEEQVASVQPNQILRRPVGASTTENAGLPSPPPTMIATLQQPVSPVPQLTQISDSTLDRRLREWEGSSEVAAAQAQNNETALPSPRLNPGLINKDVPPPSTQEHHLTEVPPPAPVVQNRREMIESQPPAPVCYSQAPQASPEQPPSSLQRRAETLPVDRPPQISDEPLPIWKRSDTAPVNSNRSVSSPVPHISSPSAEQMARLNNRMSRPVGLIDPSRRLSGSSMSPVQQQRPAGNSPYRQTWGSMGSTQGPGVPAPPINTEQTFQSAAPLAAAGAYGSPVRNSPPQSPYSSSPGSVPHNRSGLGPAWHSNSSAHSLRPPMTRLETIQSITSQPEPSPYYNQKSTMSRQLSRAERSAAKNIKDAKKKGWRQSVQKEKKLKKEQKYGGDGASSAGWTDVSVPKEGSVKKYDKNGREKSGGKCVVM